MKRILLVVLAFFLFNTVTAQYKTLYTSVNGINFFKKVTNELGSGLNEIYFQPSGISGTPCSVMDPNNSQILKLILFTEDIYRPFNGMLDRFICEDINGGCYPVGFNFFEASYYDTSIVIGHRRINSNPNSTNCNNNSYITVISTNGGESFSEIFPNKNITGIEILKSRSIAVVGLDSQVYKSTDNGATFMKMGIVPGLQNPILINYFKPYIIFAAGTDSMYRSLDSGYTFSPMAVPKLKEIVHDSHQGVTFYGVDNTHLYRGTSFGSIWTTLASFNNVNCLTVDIFHYYKIYVGTDDGFYVSTNSGYSFRKSGLNFPVSNKIIGISSYGDTLIICTDKSIYKVWDTMVGINGISNTLPSDFELYQNFPNPFNPITNIQFDLPEKASVTLVIYDVSGKLVNELVNKTLSGGKFTYSWDASNLPSGVYFARFSATGNSGKNYTETRKMMLLK